MHCLPNGFPLKKEVNLVLLCMQVSVMERYLFKNLTLNSEEKVFWHLNLFDVLSSQIFSNFHLNIFPGAYLGTVFSLPLSGYLCSSTFLGGWPSVFYIFGKHTLSFLILVTHYFLKWPIIFRSFFEQVEKSQPYSSKVETSRPYSSKVECLSKVMSNESYRENPVLTFDLTRVRK